MEERIDKIRKSLMKTKPHEVWQEDIIAISKYLIKCYYDLLLHDPDGWEGFKQIRTEMFIIHEKGKTTTCQNLVRDKEKGWMIKTFPDGSLISIKRIRIIQSYVEITKALLDAVDKLHYAEEHYFGISE